MPRSAVRDFMRSRDVECFQAYGTADLGMLAYESPAREGLILGEVVVTPFNADYPVVRFATGDLSAILEGTSPCGRTNTRIKGWMGRADQTTKVKGMFVRPEQVAEVAKRFPELAR